jgi:hypothetical protein
MPLLPPTVGERLARCEREVEVWGIVPGSDVELLINHVVADTRNVTGSGTTFSLGSNLLAGQIVTARQRQGAETSLESPHVEVGDVELPPPPPRLAPSIYRCAHCIYADGMAPGSMVTLFQGDSIEGGMRQVAQAVVNRLGFACFSPGDNLTIGIPVVGQATTCGINSTFSAPSALISAPGRFPAPHIRSPIFACQSSVDMDGLTQGASVEVISNLGSLGFFCSCWGAVHVNLPRRLADGEQISARQFMINPTTNCNIDGTVSAPPEPVIPPDARIKPIIRPILYDGDRLVRVRNQIDGGEITIMVRDSIGSPENNLGRAGASEFEEIALNDPLRAGQIVRALQSLCGRTESSDPITVQPRPATIPAPMLRPPLYDCGVLVAVDGVLPGAQVRVFQNGFPVGFAWADGPSVIVRVGPSLVQGRAITARQRVGGMDSLPSGAVPVSSLAALPVPIILPPLRIGDRSVQVGGVVPGAYVQVFDRGMLIGTADAVESIVAVSISQPIEAASDIRVSQTLCSQTSNISERGPTPHADPSEPGGRAPSTPTDTSSTGFDVPASANAPAFHVNIRGELTFPRDPGNPNAVDPNGAPYPLIIIAHGNHAASSPSYQGYRYLANHLASHGMICMSIDLNDINGRSNDFTGLDARGLVILEHIRILLARNATPGDLLHNKIDTNNIGLVGHSRGGEGVVAAQANNFSRPAASRFNIRGVVPIAPTNGLNLHHRGASIFLIYGSGDADVSGGSDFVNPFLIYDRSETPKSMIFVHHARHNGFNEVWVRPGEENESILPDTLAPTEHQAIAKAYINAFFQSVLLNRPAYDVYVQGPVRPHSLESYSIHNQYQVTNRLPIDNFGDDDSQLGLGEENPIRRENNTVGQTVAYSQSGMDVWFDQEFRLVSQNPHDSRGSQLRWAAIENYVSNVNNRDARPYSVLSIRLGQQYSTATMLNPANQSQDLLVTLITSGGEATVRVGSITDLPFPHERGGLTKAVLKTVRIPLASFSAINPAVRLDQVTAVRLNVGLTPQGAISVDDIEFSA